MPAPAIMLDDTLSAEFDALAARQGRPKAELIAEALHGYLLDEACDQPLATRDRGAFAASITQAREDIRAGRGLTQDEVLERVRASLPDFRRP